MKIIKLVKGKGEVLIDDEDFSKLKKQNWYIQKSRGKNYTIGRVKSKTISIHRFILNAPKDLQVDHIDGNGLNNQKNNLRLATNSQNHANIQKILPPHRFRGVRYLSQINKWSSRIKHNQKEIHLGCFSNKDEASRAYDKKARELFGEFAKPNF